MTLAPVDPVDDVLVHVDEHDVLAGVSAKTRAGASPRSRHPRWQRSALMRAQGYSRTTPAATLRSRLGPLAQLVEQGTLNPKVAGSSPCTAHPHPGRRGGFSVSPRARRGGKCGELHPPITASQLSSRPRDGDQEKARKMATQTTSTPRAQIQFCVGRIVIHDRGPQNAEHHPDRVSVTPPHDLVPRVTRTLRGLGGPRR